MTIKYEAAPHSAPTQHKVFNIGIITEDVNIAIKKALCEKKERIKDIEDAVFIIVIDKRNQHSILTTERTEAMRFQDSGEGESSTCYRWENDGCLWLYTCERTAGGERIGAYKECQLSTPPCPHHPKVKYKGPCPCEDD
jgi:hypothetical protein